MAAMRPRRRAGGSSGSATLEFAVIAPVLILAVLSTADIGLAINQALRIDQSIRNAAQVALDDPGATAVCAALATIDPNGGRCFTDWDVQRFHACSASPDLRVAPSAICADNRPASVFYQISGTRTHAGILLPNRDMERSVVVLVQ